MRAAGHRQPRSQETHDHSAGAALRDMFRPTVDITAPPPSDFEPVERVPLLLATVVVERVPPLLAPVAA
jgi:hypothetical protein